MTKNNTIYDIPVRDLQVQYFSEDSASSETPWQFDWIGSTPKDALTTPTSTPTSTPNLQALNFALSKVGGKYKFGSTGENNAYDCSGLIYAAYKNQGIEVPRTTEGWLSKTRINNYSGQPGDVIITASSGSPSGRHALMIKENLGNGTYACVEAANSRKGIRERTYTIGKGLKGIFRAKNGTKLIKKNYVIQ